MFRRLRPQLVIAALASATALAGTLSVCSYCYYFPPHFKGFGEVTPRGEVAGWAVDSSRPSERVRVQLYIDGRFAAYGLADLPRPDVVAAGRADDERCGYSFPLPPLPADEHEARVYALHTVGGGGPQTLLQLGRALRFTTDADRRVARPEDPAPPR